jgi:hypothetical protein
MASEAVVSLQPAPGFAHSAFSRVWERTDAPVAHSGVKRTWFWGPQPNSGGLQEEYAEGASGKRLVQYFDKSRMEINDPGADPNSAFYVTNGLLTVELISGRMQVGKNSFVARQPSRANVTGDAGDVLAPTYADLASVSNAGQDRRDPDRNGQAATATLSRNGRRGDDPSKANVAGVKIAYYEKSTGHNVPQAMWDFLNSSGTVSLDGKLSQQRLIEPWFYASGLPISDPYWVQATIAGKVTDVMIQAYERRVLTYVPTNPEGFKVEMGNIGQHYYAWRYSTATPPPTVTTVPPPSPTAQPAETRPLSRYSIDVIADTSPATLDLVKAAGAGAVRVYLSWKSLEPNNVPPAQYNWAAYDAAFKAMADRGLQPITLVQDCPPWACTRPDGPIRAERVGDFVEFMGALVARYSKSPYDTHHWEFWNEPDSTAAAGGINYHWGTYGARYAAMLGAVRPAMKAADPGAQLIMGGVAYDNFQEGGGPFVRRFVDDVLGAGGGQYLDAFNFHYYVQNIHWCSLTDKLNELRGKLKAHNLNLPIISTETGFTSDPQFGSNDDMQSLYVAQAYAQSAGERMLSTTWFLIKDFQDDVPGWGIFLKSGLYSQAGAPKPSQQAYKAAAAQIGQRPPVRALGPTDGVSAPMRGYEFAADSGHPGPLWTVWAWDLSTNAGMCGTAPAARDFSIPARLAPNLRRVLNMYGQPVQTRTASDGGLVFSLDARPVYIEWTR